ncbi:MAG: hypothetical protein ACFFDN_00285 [Candidatus Hodarchaeota archaeon]
MKGKKCEKENCNGSLRRLYVRSYGMGFAFINEIELIKRKKGRFNSIGWICDHCAKIILDIPEIKLGDTQISVKGVTMLWRIKQQWETNEKYHNPYDEIKELKERLESLEKEYDKLQKEYIDFQYDPNYMRVKI